MHKTFSGLVVICLSLAACAPEFVPDPARVTLIDTSAARDAWMGAGLPDPSACPAPRAVVLTVAEYEEAAGKPSCYADPREGCSWAHTLGIHTDAPIAVYVSGTPIAGHEQHTIAHEQAHETFHMWSECLLGRVDQDHTDARIWTKATERADASACTIDLAAQYSIEGWVVTPDLYVSKCCDRAEIKATCSGHVMVVTCRDHTETWSLDAQADGSVRAEIETTDGGEQCSFDAPGVAVTRYETVSMNRR